MSNSILEGNLWSDGLFYSVDNDFKEFFFKKENVILSKNINREQFIKDASKAGFFQKQLTKRNRVMLKKGYYVRIFLAMLEIENVSMQYVLDFIRHYNILCNRLNINSFDFSQIAYGYYNSVNKEGSKVFGVAQYIKISDILSDSQLYIYQSEFISELEKINKDFDCGPVSRAMELALEKERT
jgi:hypothetical protein